jgi:class 3 adenylate cyclase/DNA-binding SARP family transcriptional activator
VPIPRTPIDGAPSRRFDLALLGRFELTGPDGTIELPGKKLAGLLAYLACTAPRPQSREKLSTLLWGSHFDAQAKQNLRQALSRLRRILGQDALESDGEVVWLNAAAVRCDVSRFEALVREGGRDALDAAADLYRGQLIDGIAVSEEDWGEWLAAERARLLELALGALVRLAEQSLAAGLAEHALKAGRHAIALNNMREDAHRLVLRALAGTGRKAEALKHYEDLVGLLRRELNTQPDSATRSLAAELRSTQPPAGSPAVESGMPALPQTGPPSVADNPAVAGDAASSEGTARSGGAERRQLTILVCSMVGAAALAARLGPEEMRDSLATFHKGVADAVARFDGFVAQYTGHDVLVYFGYPAAHEHDTEQAVRAGLATVDAVRRLKDTSGATLQARVGIATGEVVVGEPLGSSDTGQLVAIGAAPDLAARLQAAASPGEVVIAASTRRLVGRMFDCHARDAIEIEGLAHPVEAWQVRGERTGVSRFEARRSGELTPMVGRREEIELLLRRWDQAKAGEGQVVLLSGEPGIGKSRIAESLLLRLPPEPLICLRYFCSPHHTNSALHPFIEQLKHAARFEPRSDVGARLDKLEALLKPAAKNVPRDMVLIAELLGVQAEGRYPALAVSPQQKGEMTIAAFLDQLDGVVAQRPAVIVFEDAHWIDPTSQDLLNRMVARVASLPVLLVVTGRPELQPAWVGEPHVTMLPLSRLGRRDSAGIIARVARDKTLPDEVVHQVLVQADGVPLFIEELTSTLLESGLLRETSDHYVLDGALPSLATPTTLQASLISRLDRLGPGKEAAMIGAAIGREFSHELIAAVSPLPPPDLETALERLTASGLVSRRGSAPYASYAFKHALVRDAAYVMMLRTRRRQLHESIAKTLAEQFPALADSQPEIVARHFAEAGLATEAIGHWRRAGQLAGSRGAFAEAQQAYQAALSILLTLPSSSDRDALELPLQGSLADVLRITRGYSAPETIAATTRARALSEKSGDIAQQFSQAVGMWAAASSSGDYRTARRLADQVLELALLDSSDVSLAHAHMIQMTAWYRVGNLRAAEDHFRRGKHLFKSPQFRKQAGWGAQTYGNAANIAWTLGDQVESQERIGQALSIAHENDSPYDLAFAECMAGIHAVLADNLPVAAKFAESAMRLADKQGFPQFAALSRTILGRAMAGSGAHADGIALISKGLEGMTSAGSRVSIIQTLTWLAEAQLLAGLIDDSLHTAEQALQANPQELFCRPASLQVRGNGHARKGLLAKAEQDFRDVMDLSTRMGAKLFYDRAAESLKKLMNTSGVRLR